MLNRTEYQPDFVTPPGETLQETLEVLRMTQADAASRMGRPLKTVNEIIKGKAAITPDTALQLERITAVPASFWNAREARYREYLAAEKEEKRLERKDEWLDEVPHAAMAKLGWIPKAATKVERSRNLLNFFGVATPELLERRVQAQFRRATKRGASPWAQLVWLRRGVIEGNQIDCEPYDADRFRGVLEEARSLTSDPRTQVFRHLQESCRDAGVAVVYVPELPKTCAWGATRWITTSKALIQLSLRYKSDDHFWFTFFHEAAHVLRHGKRDEFIEGAEAEDEAQQAKEREADRFATDFLIPPASYRALLRGGWNSKADVRQFANEIGIAPGIVVGRLQYDGHLPHSHYNDLKRKLRFETGGSEKLR